MSKPPPVKCECVFILSKEPYIFSKEPCSPPGKYSVLSSKSYCICISVLQVCGCHYIIIHTLCVNVYMGEGGGGDLPLGSKGNTTLHSHTHTHTHAHTGAQGHAHTRSHMDTHVHTHTRSPNRMRATTHTNKYTDEQTHQSVH